MDSFYQESEILTEFFLFQKMAVSTEKNSVVWLNDRTQMERLYLYDSSISRDRKLAAGQALIIKYYVWWKILIIAFNVLYISLT